MTDQEFQKLQNQLQQLRSTITDKYKEWYASLKNKLENYFPNFTIYCSDTYFEVKDDKDCKLVTGYYKQDLFNDAFSKMEFSLYSVKLIDDEDATIRRVYDTAFDKMFRKDITDTFTRYNKWYWDFNKSNIQPLSAKIEEEKKNRRDNQKLTINSTIKVGDVYKILNIHKELRFYIKIKKITSKCIYISTTYNQFTPLGDKLMWESTTIRKDRDLLVVYILDGFAVKCDDPVKE